MSETQDDRQQVSDGYHTFAELYQHRHLLFAIASKFGNGQMNGWKSMVHEDGSTWDGWFIAGWDLGTGQISYHFPTEYWGLIDLPAIKVAPKWDGHTSNDVLDRLTQWLKAGA